MPLKILHHKSYHVYNAENIARVKRDEAAARGEQVELDRRATVAEKEARVARLRKNARQKEGQEAERALERQLKGQPDKHAEEDTNGSMIVRPEQEVSLVGPTGHINFWSAEEAGRIPTSTSHDLALQKMSEGDKAAELTRMFLAKKGDDLRGWYATEDLKSAAERALSLEQSLDRAYKDGESKRITDPLALMQEYLDRREEVKTGHKRARPVQRGRERYPMPVTQKEDDLEPVVSRLLKQKRPSDDRTRSPTRPESFKRPSSTKEDEAKSRVSSERARAQALLAKKKHERERDSISDWDASTTASETPRSGHGGWGMYNADETRHAQQLRRDWAGMKRDRHERDRRWH